MDITLPVPADAWAEVDGRRRWLWLTVPIAALVALVSVVGLTVPGFYKGAPAWAVQAVAQDFADLVVVLPVLVASALLAARGSGRAWLIWLGTVSYLLYNFAIYAFAVPHNRLFLAYVTVLGCCLWALIGGLAATSWEAIRTRFRDDTPVKPVSLYLALLATLFYALWLLEEVPAALTGTAPVSLQDNGLLTNPVHVLDLAVMLPAMAVIAALLWRRAALGYGLAGVMLMNVLFQNIGIATVMVFSIRSRLPGSLALVGLFAALALITFALVAHHLAALEAPSVDAISR